MRIYLPVEVAL